MSISLFNKIQQEASTSYGYSNIGQTNFYLGNYSDALKNHNLAIEIVKKYDIFSLLIEEYEYISNCYAKIGNDKKANFYLQEHISLFKKENDSERTKKFDELSTIYETEKKEAQITALAKDKKIATLESQRQKTIALILGIAIISLLITSYFLFNRFKIKKQNELLKTQLVEAEKTIEAEKKATESELKALKSQMNPHFIFNALSSIQDQFMYGDKVIANEQMGNFTYLTRQILNVSGKKQILLATEIDILSKYL